MECGIRNGILIIGDVEEDKKLDLYLELISAANMASENQKKPVSLLLLGEEMEKAIEQLRDYFVNELIYIEGTGLRQKDMNIYLEALKPVLKEKKPELVFVGATAFGRILGAGIAWQMKTELIVDISNVRCQQDGTVVVTKSLNQENVLADYAVCKKPVVLSVRPGVMKRAEKIKKNTEIYKINYCDEKENTSRLYWKKRLEKKIQGEKLNTASVIVAGGRGMKSKEGFELLQKLAVLLGGVVGSTRPCVDVGWTKPSQQVGQSGTAVKPKLYLAFGISGAIQHMTAIDAEYMIAVNCDPDAAIFRYCNYGIVGDAESVLRIMIKELETEQI